MPSVKELMMMFTKKNNAPKPIKPRFNNGTKFSNISKRQDIFGGAVAKKAPPRPMAPQRKVANGIMARMNSLKKNVPNRNIAAKANANKKRNNNRGAVGRLITRNNGKTYRKMTNNEKNMLAASGSY